MSRITDDSGEGPFQRALSWFLTHDGKGGEISALSRGDLRTLAADLGISTADLLTPPGNQNDRRTLMDQMIRAHGLDPQAVRSLPAPLVTDLEQTCAGCSNARRCRRDLKAGTAAVNSASYCGNAPAFEAFVDAHQRA